MIIEHDKMLSEYTTFRIGGLCKNIFIPEIVDELYQLDIKRSIIIGGGSNLLINDSRKHKNAIILTHLARDISDLGEGRFFVGASVRLGYLLKYINDRNYGGIENLYNVPGSIGGALMMNAGSGELESINIGNFVESVTLLLNNEIVTLSKNQCKFSHRKSVFMQKKFRGAVIISCILRFQVMNPTDIITTKKKKELEVRIHQDLSFPNFGSVFAYSDDKILLVCRKIINRIFKNGINVSPKNPNWLLNKGKGTFWQTVFIIYFCKIVHVLMLKKCVIEVRIIF